MRSWFVVILILLFIEHLSAQSDSLNDLNVSGLKATYTYSGLNNIELGYGKGKLISVREMIGAAGYYGGFVNVGYGFYNNKSLLTNRVSYEFMTVVLGSRVSLINYTDFRENQITFLPELGLTYNAILTAMYGYNIHLTGNKFGINHHSFSISIIPYSSL